MSLENQDQQAYYPFSDNNPYSNLSNQKKEEVKKDLPIIGISMGDFNGIGPEVIIKTLSDSRLMNHCIPVIFGASKVFSFYKKHLGIEMTYQQYQLDNLPHSFHEHKVSIVNCLDENIEVNPSQITTQAGQGAWKSLQTASKALKEGRIDAILTAPINKDNIQSEEFSFPGHTEYLTTTFEAKESLMLLVHQGLRVGVVTGHIPLSQVAQSINSKKIAQKLDILLHSLRQDFGITKPKVALLGLNPHAGENGLLGNEEVEIIQPLIEKYREKGELVYGAFPADGFFGAKEYSKFDGILAMYHDQGLIPFKTIAFNDGVNFTAGLPIVRTSPDHGTAYGIAGKGVADPSSFRAALFMAIDTVKNRKNYL